MGLWQNEKRIREDRRRSINSAILVSASWKHPRMSKLNDTFKLNLKISSFQNIHNISHFCLWEFARKNFQSIIEWQILSETDSEMTFSWLLLSAQLFQIKVKTWARDKTYKTHQLPKSENSKSEIVWKGVNVLHVENHQSNKAK